MGDKILIIKGLGDFSTSPAGALKVVDGKVTLDKAKAFNRARLMLHNGCNTFRILRRGIWSTVMPFDFEDVGYWPLLREYVEILHQPFQAVGATQLPPGADVLVETFDGSSETWMYDPANYDRARKLIREMFANLGHLSYVKFGIGNEMNQPESRAFVRDVVYPEFKVAGKKPFSYGASFCHAGTPGPMEWQKYEAEAAWDEPTALIIYRQVHGVCDETSETLIEAVRCWVEGGNPICVILSVDGAWHGLSECDWVEYPVGSGIIQRRPSPEQIKKALTYIFDRAKSFVLPYNGQAKYGFEYIDKAMNNDECVAKAIYAIAQMHSARFGIIPVNIGQYPNDWVAPVPPECQIGETKTEKCWDGSRIITHVCIDGKWQATGTNCPPKPPTKQTWWQWLRDFRNWTWQGWLGFAILVVLLILIF